MLHYHRYNHRYCTPCDFFFILAPSRGRSLNLSDSKSPRVSGTLLCIWADLDNTVVWILLLVSNFSSPLSKPLGTISSAPTGISVNFMFQNFFSSLARSKYTSIFSLALFSTLWSADAGSNKKGDNSKVN